MAEGKQSAANQARFELEVAQQEQALQVYEFSGREEISQCFSYKVTFVCESPIENMTDWLQQAVSLRLRDSASEKAIHGLIYSLQLLSQSPRHCRYQLEIVPKFYLLNHRRNFKIFQNKTLAEIIEEILIEAGMLSNEYQLNLNQEYQPLEYKVQYGETALDFIQRLLAEAGAHYHFSFDETGHTLVIADGQEGFAEIAAVAYQADSGMVKTQHTIQRFDFGHSVADGGVHVRDYDPQRPSFKPQGSQLTNLATQQMLARYYYPGGFVSEAEASARANLLLQQSRAHTALGQGMTDAVHLSAGTMLPMTQHPNEDYNDLWLLNRIEVSGRQPQVLEEYADGAAHFDTQFHVSPWELVFRPAPIDVKRITHVDTALVTGPDGEEIYCDEQGRVKVQFHWDRLGQGDENTSCWLRVSQQWAGNGYGQFVLPRVGQEVVVSFLHGDPEQPLITGYLHNGSNAVPYELPEHKTRSSFKTLSSPGGENYNELRFEDKAGSEQVYMHAAKDWDLKVDKHRREQVLNEDHLKVAQSRFVETKQAWHQSVELKQHVTVTDDSHESIKGDLQHEVKNNLAVKTGNEIALLAGDSLVIEAGNEITLEAGGSLVKIDAGGVSLVGAGIKLNDGGSPSSASDLGLEPAVAPVPAEAFAAIGEVQPLEAEEGLNIQALELARSIVAPTTKACPAEEEA